MADPLCFFNVGQLNSNGAGIFPAPLFPLTHILTHNTVIHNGENRLLNYKNIGFSLFLSPYVEKWL